jgi:hypothetical protein
LKESKDLILYGEKKPFNKTANIVIKSSKTLSNNGGLFDSSSQGSMGGFGFNFNLGKLRCAKNDKKDTYHLYGVGERPPPTVA